MKILRKSISILSCAILLSSLLFPCEAKAQQKMVEEADTTALLQGAVVGADLFGAIQRQVSDYGQYEAFLRVNLKGKYFPVLEIGYGEAECNEDPISGVTARTKAPYMRVGCDFNVLKNKHDIYKVFIGARYGYSKFDFEFSHQGVKDEIWGGEKVPIYVNDPCNAHWLEGVFGVDAKVIGPVHLGWSFRYRRRISSKSPSVGEAWYIPGYGRAGSTCLGGTFNLSIGI